jgi:protein gp37
MSKIEWTGKTWNPLTGCSRKSAGCENCYAETMTKRLALMGQEKYQGLINDRGKFNGVIKFDEKALMLTLSVKKPTVWFVNSMSDLFHENVKNEWIDKIFAVMALCPQHTFQVLTKRADRMQDYLTNFQSRDVLNLDWIRYDLFRHSVVNFLPDSIEIVSEDVGCEMEYTSYYLKTFPLPNVWLGVSVENQKAADERIPLLLETPAAIRFLSCEPLLEEIDLIHSTKPDWLYRTHHKAEKLSMIDWVIVGGESGPGARDCDVNWIRSLVSHCRSARVPVFVKQLGAMAYQSPVSEMGTGFWLRLKNRKGGDINEFPQDLRIRQLPEIL